MRWHVRHGPEDGRIMSQCGTTVVNMAAVSDHLTLHQFRLLHGEPRTCWHRMMDASGGMPA